MQELRPGTYRFQFRDARGKVHSRTFTGTKREAKTEEARFRAQVQGGEITGDRHTIAELLHEWLEHRRPPSIKLSSWKTYETTIRIHINPHLGHLRVDKLTTVTVDRWLRSLPPDAAKKARNVLRPAYDQAILWGYVSRNPVDNTKAPRSTPAEKTPPTAAQVRALLDAPTDPQDRLFLRLAVTTGARRGELCALRWKDVSGTTITISATLTPTPTGFKLGDSTKTGKPRTVEIDPATVLELQRHRRDRLEQCFARSVKVVDTDYVFSLNWGKGFLHPVAATRLFRRYAHQVGYEGRLHDLRHYVATSLLAAGVPIADAAGRLGHTPNTMLKTYAHSVPGGDTRAATVMGELAGGQT